MAVIYRGSTPILRFKPTNGMHVSELGTPVVAISQELVFISYEGERISIDTEGNSISVRMDEADTLRLVAGVPTSVQEVWYDTDGNVVRFPVQTVTVSDTIIGSVLAQA